MLDQTDTMAMVLAHGNHELFAAGMIQQYQPHLLYITCGSHPENNWTEEQARLVLKSLGFRSTVTFLPVVESEVHHHMLSRNDAWFVQLRDQVAAWLNKVNANIVFTDAFEWYNSVHDLCSLLVDAAIEAAPLPLHSRPLRFDLPLAFQTMVDCSVGNQSEDGLPYLKYSLTEEQTQRKRAILQRVSPQDTNIREVIANWTPERYEQEVYQPVPTERDYRVAPRRSAWNTYDDHGKQRVSSGRYEQAILFHEHYAPIAEALFDKASISAREAA